MEKLTEVLSMGGFAKFVWFSYGITALVLVIIIYVSLSHRRMVKMRLAKLESSSHEA